MSYSHTQPWLNGFPNPAPSFPVPLSLKILSEQIIPLYVKSVSSVFVFLPPLRSYESPVTSVWGAQGESYSSHLLEYPVPTLLLPEAPSSLISFLCSANIYEHSLCLQYFVLSLI